MGAALIPNKTGTPVKRFIELSCVTKTDGLRANAEQNARAVCLHVGTYQNSEQ